MEEIWKDITGYEGLYQISNLGNVVSLNFNRENKRKQLKKLTRTGYYYVCLSKNNVKKNKNLHRIIAEHFIPNPENKPQINHKNGIKKDNRIENLEWVTSKENMVHAWKNNLNYVSKKSIETAKKQCKKNFSKTTLDTETGIFYDSFYDACYYLNLNYQNTTQKYYRNTFKRLKYV